MNEEHQKQHEQAQPASSAAELKIEKRQDGRLWTKHEGKDVALRVRPCFPWSDPDRYVSLRDDNDNEIAMIEDLDSLTAATRDLMTHALAQSGFVMEIEAVLAMNEEFEVRTWQVRTCQGTRRFQTKRDDWPSTVGANAMMIRDIAGDLYCIRDANSLDPHSRKLLAPFID